MDMDRRSHRAKTINVKTQPITMSRHVYRPITMALLAMPLIALAQTQPDPNAAAAARTSALQDQLQQERERALERDRQWQAPDVRRLPLAVPLQRSLAFLLQLILQRGSTCCCGCVWIGLGLGKRNQRHRQQGHRDRAIYMSRHCYGLCLYVYSFGAM